MRAIELLDSYEMICDKSLVSGPDYSDGRYSFSLKEADKAAKIREVTIYDVPPNTLLLSMQKYENLKLGNYLKSILKAELGIFMSCDFLLISETKKGLFLTFIELKSREFSNSDVKKQFKGASCFIEYCHAIIEYFLGRPMPKLSAMETRYVLISGRTPRKRPTKYEKYVNLSSPDNYYHHGVGNANASFVPFGKLI